MFAYLLDNASPHPRSNLRYVQEASAFDRYTMTLREYLGAHSVSTHTRCLLLAQLLEGIAHLEKHGIAHRDLKSDNILVDLSHGAGEGEALGAWFIQLQFLSFLLQFIYPSLTLSYPTLCVETF